MSAFSSTSIRGRSVSRMTSLLENSKSMCLRTEHLIAEEKANRSISQPNVKSGGFCGHEEEESLRLIVYFAVLSVNDLHKKEISFFYPTQLYDGGSKKNQLPFIGLESYCFPISKSSETECFVSTLISDGGKKSYVICMNQSYEKEDIWGKLKNEEANKQKRCYCIISNMLLFDIQIKIIRRILSYQRRLLENLLTSNSAVLAKTMELIDWYRRYPIHLGLRGEIKLKPCPDITPVRISRCGMSREFLRTELARWALPATLKYLSVDVLLQTLSAILLAKPVIIYCSNAPLLSCVGMVWMALMYPFTYDLAHILILPDYIYEMVACPVPYIFGVLTDPKEFDERGIEINSNAVVLYVESNQLICINKIPHLPQHKKIKSLLLSYAECIRTSKKKTEISIAVNYILSIFEQIFKPMLIKFERCCILQHDVVGCAFLENEFLSLYSKKDQKFLKLFLTESPIFMRYKDAYMERKEEEKRNQQLQPKLTLCKYSSDTSINFKVKRRGKRSVSMLPPHSERSHYYLGKHAEDISRLPSRSAHFRNAV